MYSISLVKYSISVDIVFFKIRLMSLPSQFNPVMCLHYFCNVKEKFKLLRNIYTRKQSLKMAYEGSKSDQDNFH